MGPGAALVGATSSRSVHGIRHHCSQRTFSPGVCPARASCLAPCLTQLRTQPTLVDSLTSVWSLPTLMVHVGLPCLYCMRARSRARALGERLQMLQLGVPLEGWPMMGTSYELASQAVQQVYTVTDDQLTPPPGSTFDRCLEELLFQQYGLSVRVSWQCSVCSVQLVLRTRWKAARDRSV
eukprot:COSAG02_NODE_1681_length_11351_cov_20.077320_11_plen_180_part_00